jgi:iron complex outermembrane recepter protein
MIRKSAFLASAGLIAVATPAFAQTTPPPTNESGKPTTAPPTQTSTAQTGAVSNQALEQQPVDTGNIIITATRRNQALSDVPMAVSAVTAENLRNTGATDIRQLNQIAPSLLVSSTQSEAGAAVARIRGVGTVGDNPGLEGSVGVFIDGVYRARTGMGLTELGALDRIEVLRGPQGTLFGRNTSAGLISIITAKPRFTPEAMGQVDVGNYNFRRVEAGVTGPISSTLAARLDGVYSKRDGFLKDVISGRDINDRNRWLLRGQLLYQPNDNFSVRLIGDDSRLREECCGAAYLPVSDTVVANGTITHQPSTIAGILRGLGAVVNDDTYARRVAITPGRNYRSDVNDWGVSGEGVYNFGGAELTSITAYRFNRYTRGQDADFNNLDIVYRDDNGGAQNRFKTFSQELRLQGDAFGGHLNWLVGGYYSNEKLRVLDNIAYGTDYSRFANCLVANKFAQLTGQSALVSTANPTCFNPAVANALLPFVGTSATALSAFARLGVFAAPTFTNSGFTNLSIASGAGARTLTGTGVNDRYDQTSNNFAVFTHNIVTITDQLKLTLGARYTHEKKTLNANLNDVGGLTCALFGGGIASLAPLQQLPCAIPSLPGGHLAGTDSHSENKLSGTAVLSYKPTDRLLTYISYSRGYKAGGFNLDRTALARFLAFDSAPDHPVIPGAVRPNAPLSDLRFKPETNDALEIGAKYNGRGIDVNVAVFRQLFTNFQLNTFNGINFFVENINSCKNSLNGLDRDNVQTIDANGNALNTGACTGGTRAGVKNEGVELEVFARPMRDVSVNFGTTYASTKYRNNLVGAGGRAITNSLFQLPGREISNAPRWTTTGSLSWTPPINDSGLHALFYIDARHTSTYNTGSDLDIEKVQDPFTVVNARVGIRGPGDSWALELWAQNLFDANYKQVAFDAFAQGSCTTRGAQNGFCSPIPNRATQLYAAFLGEPRTFGVTLRAKTGFARGPAPAYAPPPAPPPVVEQAPPPPPPAAPPPPPPAAERGQ